MSTGEERNDDRSPWIAVKTRTPHNRKILALHRTLGLNSRHEALGVIIEVWCQTFTHCWEDGDWSAWSPSDFEALIGFQGEAGSLIKALQDVGLMDSGTMKIHDWRKINTRLLGRRESYYLTKNQRTLPPTLESSDPNYLRKRTKRAIAE